MNECKRHGCRRSAVRVYCSEQCRVDHIAATRPRRDKHEKSCEICGTQFVAARSHQRTCSGACRVALHRQSPKTVKAKAKKAVRRPKTGVKVSDLDTHWSELSKAQKARLLAQIQN